jgi:hypothetical protein
METKKFYRVYDFQLGKYFATGYNSQSMEELVNNFKSYIETADECEGIEQFTTWGEIEEYLQGVELEESNIQFTEIYD